MIAIVITLICLLVFLLLRTKTRKCAPGPWGFPILGHLPLLGNNPAATILEWTNKYGPIISVRFGAYPAVVINDAKLINSAFALPAFSGRPSLPVLDVASGGRKGVALGDGPKTQEQRKFLKRNLKDFGLTSSTMEDVILGNAAMINARLEREADTGKPFRVNYFFNVYCLNCLWSIVTGEPLDPEGELGAKLTAAVAQITAFSKLKDVLCLFIPGFITWFPVWSGFKERLEIFRIVENFLVSQIELLRGSRIPNRPRNMVEAYLDKVDKTVDEESSFHSKQNYISMSLQDIFVGGLEPTGTALEWIFYYLAKYPKVQCKLQNEIWSIIGGSRIPCVADRSRMPYTEAFINEVLRITSFFRFGLFHSTLEDVELNSYFIPKNTMVLANIYGAHNDPQVWDQPRELRPERFLDAEGNILKIKEFIPFCSGNRKCLGSDLAPLLLFLTTVSICQTFTVCSTGVLPDEMGVNGFTVPPHTFDVFIKKAHSKPAH